MSLFKEIFADGMTLLVDFVLELIGFDLRLRGGFIFLIGKILEHSLARVPK